MVALVAVGFGALANPTSLALEGPRSVDLKSPGGPVQFGSYENFCLVLRLNGILRIQILALYLPQPRFQNLFQTSDLNHGIRVEVNPKGELSIAIGGAVTSGFFSTELGTIQGGSKFTLTLELMKTRIRFSLDSNRYTNWRKTPVLAPQCNKFTIGGGFDQTRDSFGAVRASFHAFESAEGSLLARLSKSLSRSQFKILSMMILIISLNFMISNIVQWDKRADKE